MRRYRQEHPMEEVKKTSTVLTQKLERMIHWDSEESRDVHVDLLLPSDKSRVVKKIDFRNVQVELGRPLVHLSGASATSSTLSHGAITSANKLVPMPYDFLENTMGEADIFDFYESDYNLRKWSILKKWASPAEMCKGVRLTDEQAEIPSNAGVLGTLQRRASAQDGGFELEKRQVLVGACGDGGGTKETVFLCPRARYDQAVAALSSLFAATTLYGDNLRLHFDSVGKTKGSMVVSVIVAIVD